MRNCFILVVLLTVLAVLLPATGQGANPCFATLSAALKLEVPFLNVFGSSYNCRFELRSEGPARETGVWLVLEDISAASASDCSNPARLFQSGAQYVLRTPVIRYATTSFWADFNYQSSSDGKVWFRFADGGFMAHQVFVTSARGSGNLGGWSQAGGKSGLAAGDEICQALAKAAGLPANFVAWLSDTKNDAYCRVHGLTGKKSANCGQMTLPESAGPWVRTDGFPFSPSIGDLLNLGELYVPLRTDETGQPGSYWYRTGTQSDGSVYDRDGAPCADWTSSADVTVAGSVSSFTSSFWTIGASSGCAGDYAGLVCLQTGAGQKLPNFALPGKQAFLTSVKGTGNLGTWPEAKGKSGLAAGDEICRSLASAAGLGNANLFKAWLSDDTTNAIDRFTSAGPWVRLDGVLVAENKTDLSDGLLNTTVNLTETGTYKRGFDYVWTGTNHVGEKSTDHCNNWSDASETFSAAGGRAFDSSGWTFAARPFCAWQEHLYCFED